MAASTVLPSSLLPSSSASLCCFRLVMIEQNRLVVALPMGAMICLHLCRTRARAISIRASQPAIPSTGAFRQPTSENQAGMHEALVVIFLLCAVVRRRSAPGASDVERGAENRMSSSASSTTRRKSASPRSGSLSHRSERMAALNRPTGLLERPPMAVSASAEGVLSCSRAWLEIVRRRSADRLDRFRPDLVDVGSRRAATALTARR